MILRGDDPSGEWAMSDSGLYLPADIAKKPRRPLAVDLFSGCGGMSLGLVKGGFDVIAGLEWDPCAIQTYLVNLGAYPVTMVFSDDEAQARMEKSLQKNFDKAMKKKGRTPIEGGDFMSGSNRYHLTPEFPGVKFMFVGDARKFSGLRMLEIMGLEPGDIDLVAGGPPCQGFSLAGKRNRMDPRNSLVFEFARLVLEIQPKTICMENVPGILNMVTPEGVPVMDAFCHLLSEGGFGLYDSLKKSLLESAGCGAALKTSRKDRAGEEAKAEPEEGQRGLFA